MSRVEIRKVDMQSLSCLNKKTLNKLEGSNSFDKVLDKISVGIKFSKHAEERLKSRSVELDKIQLEKIEVAIDKAEKKGIKETLLLMDDMAFIASTKNKTIITTVPKESLKENIFTNIDGAVII